MKERVGTNGWLSLHKWHIVKAYVCKNSYNSWQAHLWTKSPVPFPRQRLLQMSTRGLLRQWRAWLWRTRLPIPSSQTSGTDDCILQTAVNLLGYLSRLSTLREGANAWKAVSWTIWNPNKTHTILREVAKSVSELSINWIIY